MAARKQSALDKGRAIQQNLLDKASDVYESTKRVHQLSLPMASGTKADQMLMPGFDVGNILDPARTWRPKR